MEEQWWVRQLPTAWHRKPFIRRWLRFLGRKICDLAMSWCWKNDGGRWSDGELKQLGFDSVAVEAMIGEFETVLRFLSKKVVTYGFVMDSEGQLPCLMGSVGGSVIVAVGM
ncbi:hypothetical protein F0562_011719 [Nyssa sinensis]|uniref:Uncharacterized protein n=1 Tax=Nyssa sinensis TaxID=561372 RepID=A0A5J4ZTZ4_9ASTE|nr:hypothetical protein F0562_011719 [Nyssa sinensis]